MLEAVSREELCKSNTRRQKNYTRSWSNWPKFTTASTAVKGSSRSQSRETMSLSTLNNGRIQLPGQQLQTYREVYCSISKSKKCLQIAKCCYYYLCSRLPLQKALTYPKIFWGMVPWRLKSNLRLHFFHIHLHEANSPDLGTQLPAHTWKEMGVTTILMQDNLIFQGSLDFCLPKCFGIYSQNSRNCKFPCIAFIDRLGKKRKKIPLPNMSIKKKSPTRTDHCPFSPAVCLQNLKQETLCRESNQPCLWFTILIPKPSQGIRDLCLWTCRSPSEPTVSPQSLTKTGYPPIVVYSPHFFLLQATGSPQNSLRPPCVSTGKLSRQTGHKLSSVKNSRDSSRVPPFTFLQTARRNQNCQTQAPRASVEITTQRSTGIICKFAL